MKMTSVPQISRPANDASTTRFRLGPVDVDPESGRVAGPGGQLTLDPKVVAVLVRLAREPGRIVSRDTLMDDVWGDLVVSDYALSRCIYQLRKKLARVALLDESAIETLPKRGYRLNWKVQQVPAASLPADSGFVFAGIIAAVSLIGMALWSNWGPAPADSTSLADDELRLVIFPFDDLSEARDQRVFAEGLGREIQHRLATLPGLTLIGRTSAFNPERERVDLLAQAERLDASYVLGGSVQSLAGVRRVLVDLRAVPAGELLWSREFVIDGNANFDVVQDVAREVVTRFRFSADAGFGQETTSSLEAFEAYLAAFAAESYDQRRQALLRAVELDPFFAKAWNALAGMEVYPVWTGQKTVEDAWAIAAPSIERALSINPNLPDVHITLGRFKREFGNLDEAIEHFEKALDLDPGNPDALANLGIVLRPAGRYEQALQAHQLAVALDPLDALAQARLGTSHWLMENHDEAARHYTIAAELKPDDEEIYDSWSAMLSLGLGRFDEALQKLDRKMLIERNPAPRTLTRAGELASALRLDELAERYFDAAAGESSSEQTALVERATHYLSIGEDGAARSLAARALELSPENAGALAIMGTFDVEAGFPELFLERLEKAYPALTSPDTRAEDGIFETLLVATAFGANGNREAVDRLAQSVIDRVGHPRSYQHLWLAVAHALRGDGAAAMRELRESPTGWVRQRAWILDRDPGLAALHSLPEFQRLIAAHRAELDRQRDAYLAHTMATTPAEIPDK
jgi:tetratricopeptide (TPR) repeat protein/DNA-binding winged helix-turn-helix (wHTH) protein